MTIVIIVAVVVLLVLALQVVKAGAYADWQYAKFKCSDCKHYDGKSDEQREIFCLKQGWMTADEVRNCKRKEQKWQSK